MSSWNFDPMADPRSEMNLFARLNRTASSAPKPLHRVDVVSESRIRRCLTSFHEDSSKTVVLSRTFSELSSYT